MKRVVAFNIEARPCLKSIRRVSFCLWIDLTVFLASSPLFQLYIFARSTHHRSYLARATSHLPPRQCPLETTQTPSRTATLTRPLDPSATATSLPPPLRATCRPQTRRRQSLARATILCESQCVYPPPSHPLSPALRVVLVSNTSFALDLPISPTRHPPPPHLNAPRRRPASRSSSG